VELETFLRDSEIAEAAVKEALREIESVRENLAPEDYTYLKTCFADALPMLEAVRLTAAGARASARCMESRTEENQRDVETACIAMEACADRIEAERGIDFHHAHWFFKTRLNGKEIAGYGVPVALRAIAEKFRTEREDR
jgi:hypothetical protein